MADKRKAFKDVQSARSSEKNPDTDAFTKCLGLSNLQNFLDTSLEDAIQCKSQTKEPTATELGKIGPNDVMFDVKSNVGTLVMEPDKLGGTSLSNFSTIRANCCVYKGKWVYELMLGSKGVMQLGWCTINCKFSVEEGVGDTPDSYAYDGSRLRKWNSWLTGDVISCALDCDNGTVTFYRNGKSMGQAFSTTEEADILPDRKGNPVPPSPLGRGAYIVEACLMKFLLELTDADISEVLNLMWSLMQEFEIKPCLENLIISILSSYRFSPVTTDFKFPKDDKPAELETPEEKSQKESYITACDQLRKKIEELEQIQVEMLKVLLLHNDVSIDIIHVNTCPLPVMLCFFHRMIQALRFYWDDFRKEDISRFVLSQDAFMPIHEFWAETRDYFEFQRCGGLLSHINRMLGGEVNKAQGLTVKQDGEVVSIDSTKQKVQNKDAYPEIEMPSGNSLMELLDGIIILYHTGAHKQLAKMSTLRDNLKEYSSSLQDAETKLNNCPPEELIRSRDVFKEKVVEQARQMAWVNAVIFSKPKQEDVAWVLKVTLKTIQKASHFRLLFQYTPEFYIETVINSYNALKNYFHPSVTFNSLQDVRDNIVQALACFICFPSSLKTLEELPMENKLSMIRSLIGPYENRSWAQTNWILVRIWKIQQKVARTELRILEGRQLKICATCFEIAVYLMRVLEMVISLVPELFLDFSRDSAELLLGRLTQLLCQVLNRITTKSGMFDNVVSMYIQGKC
ncbi:hypothetical protein KUTeg_021016, partial [Tegillarca granosa]